MNPTSLQLERYFFSKIQLEASAETGPKASHKLRCSAEFGEEVDDPKRFQVILRLKLEAPPNAETRYSGEFHAVGLFRVVAPLPRNHRRRLVEAHGADILYGALRELIYTLTSRGPWPAITLPLGTFADGSLSETKPDLKLTPQPKTKLGKSLLGPKAR